MIATTVKVLIEALQKLDPELGIDVRVPIITKDGDLTFPEFGLYLPHKEKFKNNRDGEYEGIIIEAFELEDGKAIGQERLGRVYTEEEKAKERASLAALTAELERDLEEGLDDDDDDDELCEVCGKPVVFGSCCLGDDDDEDEDDDYFEDDEDDSCPGPADQTTTPAYEGETSAEDPPDDGLPLLP